MPHEALRTILPIAGWPEEKVRAVEFTGGADPVLPTPFRIGAAGAAALAATGLAAADLWELRTGRRQEVAVDLRRAVAALRSGHYMQINGAAVPTDRNPVMGVYPAKNGRWSYIHANFPNHRAAAMQVLGVPEDKEAVRQAVAKWDALELEEAILAAKGAGGMVRSMAEWAQHPQSAAIASLPLMEIIKIGDSPVEKLPEGDRPLVRDPGAGPDAGSGRADLGAHACRARCGGHEDHRTAPAEYRLPGIRHRPRQIAGASRPAAEARSRHAPGSGARGRRLHPGLPAGDARQSRPVARGIGEIAPGLGLRVDVRLQPCRPLGLAPRLRHRRADGQRHHHPPGRTLPRRQPRPAILSGLGDRLSDRLSDGVRRDDGIGAAGAGGRQLAGAHLIGANREDGSSIAAKCRKANSRVSRRRSRRPTSPAGRSRARRRSGACAISAPTVQLSETAPRWARPSAPLGYHQPVWPARAA